MQAIASSDLEKTFKTEVSKTLSDFGGSRGQCLPINCRVRIEIEYHPVRLLDCPIARAPWMHLKHPQLSQLDKGLRRGERDIRLGLSGLFVSDVDAAKVGRQRVVLVLLIEA